MRCPNPYLSLLLIATLLLPVSVARAQMSTFARTLDTRLDQAQVVCTGTFISLGIGSGAVGTIDWGGRPYAGRWRTSVFSVDSVIKGTIKAPTQLQVETFTLEVNQGMTPPIGTAKVGQRSCVFLRVNDSVPGNYRVIDGSVPALLLSPMPDHSSLGSVVPSGNTSRERLQAELLNTARNTPDPLTAMFALNGLTRLRPFGAPILSGLKDALVTASDQRKADLLATLIASGEGAAVLAAVAYVDGGSADEGAIGRITRSLQGYGSGPERLPELKAVLRSGNPVLRRAAISEVRGINDKAALSVLGSAVGDNDPTVQWGALIELKHRLGDDAPAVPPLDEFLANPQPHLDGWRQFERLNPGLIPAAEIGQQN